MAIRAHIAALFVLAVAASPVCHAAEEIELAGPDWKAGDSLRLEVKKEKSRTELGKPPRSGGSRSVLKLRVLEATAQGGYVLSAEYEQITRLGAAALTPAIQLAAQSMLEAVRAMRLEIELDEQYEPTRIRNLPQVRPQLVALFQMLDESRPGVEAAQTMERLLQNDQVATALLLREVKPFFGLMGTRIELGRHGPSAFDMPNPLGSGSVSGTTELTATATEQKPRAVKVQIENRPDNASIAKMAEVMIRAMDVSVPDGKLDEVFRSASFVDRTVYELREDRDGIPEVVTHTREISAGPFFSREVTTLRLLAR